MKLTRTHARVVSVVLTALVSVWFAARPQPVLVGVTPQETLVPWWYQAAAFPPFFLLLAGFVLQREARVARAVLMCGVSAFALVRLAGLIPFSGHGMFLAAALVFTATDLEERDVFVTSSVAIVLTAISKFGWNDLPNFFGSVLAGAAWGALSRMLRARHGRSVS
ncbi:MAG: hypothetical protein QM817_28220 [Archangium sp.]